MRRPITHPFTSVAIVTTCKVMLIKAVLCHAAHFCPRGPSVLCVTVITASMKLSSEIFAVRHSPYPVSKFELGRPNEHGEHFFECFLWQTRTWIWKKTQWKGHYTWFTSPAHSRHTWWVCVAQLSLSRAVVFFLPFAAAFSRDAAPCVIKMLKLARNYSGHS